MVLFSSDHTPVHRGTDALTTVRVPNNAQCSSYEIAQVALRQLALENTTYKPDNAGAILIFHTETGAYVLGSIRSNPALSTKSTIDGTTYPEQISASIGGYNPNPLSPFRISAINAIRNKMFLNTDLIEEGVAEQQRLRAFCQTLEADEGWEEKMCIHTDHWKNEDSSAGTMCVLTAIKHINATDLEKDRLENDLQKIMQITSKTNQSFKTLSNFKFVELTRIIQTSLETHLLTEEEKAMKAYQQFGNNIAVTFNDLAIATLAKHNALLMQQSK